MTGYAPSSFKEGSAGELNSPADWGDTGNLRDYEYGIAGGIIQGCSLQKPGKRYKKYVSQKAGERVNQDPPEGDGFRKSRKKRSPAKWNRHSRKATG